VTVDPEPTQEELGIVGRSPQIRQIVDDIRRIAPSDLTVLLVGESGVGKEVFASAIHKLSRRADERMIAINCGAIPETLLESELFGHERGAFTGAVETRKGLFESADRGTIFLDEIGEMSLATQVKLLRVLETFEFSRVGSNESRHADVRVIAATNRDLERDVERGAFRRDLYYRLRSAQVWIPPLRERRDDIQLLFAHFAFQIARRLSIPFGGITPDAMQELIDYVWPGNVRELRNFVELVVTIERGAKITAETVAKHLGNAGRPPLVENPNAIIHLAGRTPEQAERELIYRALIDLRNEVGAIKQFIASSTPPAPVHSAPALPPAPPDLDRALESAENLRLDEMERRMIRIALKRYHGNRRSAAHALGISERTLYRKLIDYKLKDDGSEEESQ
jgi:transcriptional regulator with PAS, ATPase and Fis domain